MHRWISTVLGFLLSVANTSCSPGSGNDPPPVAHLEEELRIGAIDDEVYGFTNVIAVTLTTDSLLLVMDYADRAIKVFDWGGRFQRQIGRAGGGPGEFINPVTMGVLGDTLWIQDMCASAVLFMDLSGRERRRVTFPPVFVYDGGGTISGPSRPLPDGTFLGQVLRMRSGGIPTLPFLKLDSAGTVLDTLIDLPTSWRGNGKVGNLSFSIPLRDASMWAFSPDSRWLAFLERPVGEGPPGYRVTTISWQGDTVYSRFFPVDPIPLEDELREEFLQEALAAGAPGLPRKAWEEVFDQLPYFPTASNLMVDGAGRVWVCRETIPHQARTWEVLDEMGNLLFSIQLPEGARVLEANGDMAWVVEKNVLDVPYVVRYRIHGL